MLPSLWPLRWIDDHDRGDAPSSSSTTDQTALDQLRRGSADRRQMLLGLFGLPAGLGLLGTSCASPSRAPTKPATDTPHLRVMSYNVNYGLAGDQQTIDTITNQDVDLICLQETTDAWERVLRNELARDYPHIRFRHCCGAGGLAFLSKRPFETRYYERAAKVSGSWFPAWLIEAQTPIGALQIMQVHLRPPASDSGSFVSGYFSTPSVRQDEIAAHLKKLDLERPALVLGDFNEGEDGRAVQAMRKSGLRSVLPEYHPGADTWRWKTSVGTIRTQLDHIAYRPQQLRPLNAEVLQQGRSDHLPLIATFERS